MPTTNTEKVPSIKVGGADKVYNGKIFNFNYTFNFGQGPNTLEVSVVNEYGDYQEPNLNLSEKKQINLDNFDLGEMIAFKYRKRISSQGNVLDVFFIDETYVLDKIFIGLVSKHGWTEAFDKKNNESAEKTFEELTPLREWGQDPKAWSSSSSSPFKNKSQNFYLIGRLFHPCDTNKDNLIDFDEATNFNHCDPCPSCPDDKYETRCKELGYTQIFEVGYSLKDLEDMFNETPISVDGISIKIDFGSIQIKPVNGKDPKKDYYRDYSGNLREVLTAWCDDFGLIWWYDPQNKEIKFLDVSSKEIKLDSKTIIDKYDKKKLISYELEKTAENTYQNGVISWYQRAGEKADFTCEKATTVVLSALYGADFLGNRYRETQKDTKLNSNHDILGSILGAYHPILRNAFWQRQAYDLRKPVDFAEYITDLKGSSSSSSSSGGDSSSSSSSGEDDDPKLDKKTIYEMGNVKILAVIAKPPVDGGSDFHNTVKNKWEELSVNPTLSDFEIKKIRDKKAWFIVTYMDEDALEQRLDLEGEVYDFLGKFFVREHMFRLCGITGNDEFVKNNTNIESADGSAQIYSKKDGIGTNPLSRYKYYKSGYLGCIMGTGNVSTGEVATPLQNNGGGTEGNSIPGSTQGFNIEKFKGNVVLTDTHEDYRNAEKQAGTLFSQKYGTKHIPRLEQTAIILERDAMWVPETQIFQDAYSDYIVNNYGDSEWKLYGNDGVPVTESEWMAKALDDLKDGRSGKIKIFIVYPEKKEFKVKPFEEDEFKSTAKKHSKDKTANTTRKVVKRIGGKYSPETPIGLIDNSNHKIEIDELLTIETPPHVFIKEGVGGAKELIKKDAVTQGNNNNSPCDKVVKDHESKFRKPAYRVYLSQSFNQKVTLPRIQTGVNSGMSPSPDVIKLNVLYNGFTDDDLFAFTGSGVAYGCIPNLEYLKKIHDAYTSKTFSNTDPDENLSISIKGLPEFEELEQEVKKGLSNFSIQLDQNGSNSTINYNTVQIKSISSELTKWWNTKSAIVAGRRING